MTLGLSLERAAQPTALGQPRTFIKHLLYAQHFTHSHEARQNMSLVLREPRGPGSPGWQGWTGVEPEGAPSRQGMGSVCRRPCRCGEKVRSHRPPAPVQPILGA